MRRHDHDCIVPRCEESGRNQIGVRCRVAHDEEGPFPTKKRTHALFSVESDAYLCDRHALAGVSIALALSPNTSEEASLAVACGRKISDLRTTVIKQPLEAAA